MRVVDNLSKTSLLLLLFLQFIFCATVFFDVPVSRQVIGFIYLTFIPGYIFFKLLKVNNLGMLQTVLFSAGLSIALLMLLGLIVNEIGILLGCSTPLSSLPLMLTLNMFVLIGELIIYLKKSDSKLFDFKVFGKKPLILFLIGLVVLSVVGAIWVNVFGSNLILLFVILTIAVFMAVSIVIKRLLPPKFYPLVILSIALALLFHSSLISNYIHGFDIPVEYHVFAVTQDSGFWNQTAHLGDPYYSRFNGMLSITVLPTLYSNILNMDGTWVFNIIFQLIFSLVPLGFYELWHPNFNKKTALIASFLFMSQLTFHAEMVELARQTIAELFFVLLLLLVLSKKLENSAGAKFCFIILSFGLVVSHYAMALIFLFFILFVWAFYYLTKRRLHGLSLSLLLFFCTMMFVWYVFTSGSGVFESILSFGSQISNNIGEFFNPASRGSTVLQGLGMEAVTSQWVLLSRIFAYATEFFILLGSVVILLGSWRAKFARSLSQTYSVFVLAALMILAMCILIPAFASTLNMSRFYNITLFFLAPAFVVGCETLTHFVVKRRIQLVVSLLVMAVIVPYFLFQTNFVYEVVKEKSWSLPLSGYRMDKTFLYFLGYVEEVNVIGAQWIYNHTDLHNIQLYADFYSRNTELRSYGKIANRYTIALSNVTTVTSNGTVYLSKLNVVYGKIAGEISVWNSSELNVNFAEMNKIYTNGGSEIYIKSANG